MDGCPEMGERKNIDTFLSFYQECLLRDTRRYDSGTYDEKKKGGSAPQPIHH